MQVWKAYNFGPAELFTPEQVQGFGTSQGPTDLFVMQPLSVPRGGWCFLDPQLGAVSVNNLSLARQSVEEISPADKATKVYFSCPQKGCTKTLVFHKSTESRCRQISKFREEDQPVTSKENGLKHAKRSRVAICTKKQGQAPEQLSVGWKLKTSLKATCFSETVTSHLKKILLEGE